METPSVKVSPCVRSTLSPGWSFLPFTHVPCTATKQYQNSFFSFIHSKKRKGKEKKTHRFRRYLKTSREERECGNGVWNEFGDGSDWYWGAWQRCYNLGVYQPSQCVRCNCCSWWRCSSRLRCSSSLSILGLMCSFYLFLLLLLCKPLEELKEKERESRGFGCLFVCLIMFLNECFRRTFDHNGYIFLLGVTQPKSYYFFSNLWLVYLRFLKSKYETMFVWGEIPRELEIEYDVYKIASTKKTSKIFIFM